MLFTIELLSQRFSIPGELHVQYSAGREGGNVVSLVDVPDVHMESTLLP